MIRFAPLAPLLALLAITGCSGDADVLARVGSREITRDDFLAAARGSSRQYAASGDSGKLLLLDDLVRRELMIQGAHRLGLYRDSTFLAFRENAEREMLRARIRRDLLGPLPGVSDAEIAALHARRAEETKVRLLYAFDEAAARAARAAVEFGEDFASVASRFNNPDILPAGGDLGFIGAGVLPKELDARLHEAAIGPVLGPIEVPAQGWFLMRVEGRRVAPEQPPLDEMREDLRTLLRQRKRRVMLTRNVLELRRAYDVRLRPGAANELVQALRPPGGESDLTPAELEDGQRAIVLGDYRGGVYTLGEAAIDLEQAPNRPNFNLRPTVERWLDTQVLERASLAEAARRRYAAEPEFQRELRERLNGYLLDAYYGQVVMGAISIDEEKIREAHRRRADAFVRLDQVRLLTATFRDSAAASRFIVHAGHSGTLRDAAAMVAGVRVHRETIRYPSTDPLWASLQALFMQSTPGETLGPYPTEKGWIVFQLESKDQVQQTYEELSPAVQQRLMNEAVELEREARLQAVTDSLRGVIPVVTHPRRALRVSWPAPPIGAESGA